MKRILIIQTDEAYFLFETLQILNSQWSSFHNTELHLLINKDELKKVNIALKNELQLHFNTATLKDISFDESYNLSLNDQSWKDHESIKSSRKIGAYNSESGLNVKELWSTYLLTLKTRAPFVTFHLRDIYRRILELGIPVLDNSHGRHIERIVYSPLSSECFRVEEQEKFLRDLSIDFPSIPIIDVSELDDDMELATMLYIGPANFTGCKIVTSGARGFFLQTHFQGMNFIPYKEGQIVISSEGTPFLAKHLTGILEGTFKGKYKSDIPYNVYFTERESSSNLYLRPHFKTDKTYSFYQSHFVLWNFLLSLEDVSLPLSQSKEDQKSILKDNINVLSKLIALQKYALEATNSVLKQAKAKLVDTKKLEMNLEIIRDYDQTALKIAEGHPLLRPFIDFYHIRKGQTGAFTLQEQAEEALLISHEEHQALSALQELFSVTLNKNEAKI